MSLPSASTFGKALLMTAAAIAVLKIIKPALPVSVQPYLP